MEQKIAVTCFYKFLSIPQEQLAALGQKIQTRANELDIKGLILLAVEGCNSTVAGKPEAIAAFKQFLLTDGGFPGLTFKDSAAASQPFFRLRIDIRPEIVTLKDPSVRPDLEGTNYLSPAEWQKTIENENDIVVIDTRNTYETKLGKFKGAVDPQIKNFSDFPKFVEQSGIPKDKKVLMYCTGGIRCEKASIAMRRLGYDKVYQLEGGILKYLEEFPEQQFEGECFVFDHRVSVDQHLAPSSRYHLCVHCGDPADIKINCYCGGSSVICEQCNAKEELRTCSKNCSYHYSRVAKVEAA